MPSVAGQTTRSGMNPAEFANIAAAEEQMWWFRGMRRILDQVAAPVLQNRKLERVFEGGCGTGHQSRVFEARYGWRVTALDFDFGGLRYARGAGQRRLVQGDLGELPFGDSLFDAAFALDVLAHFPKGTESKPLAELYRVLKPGGVLIVRTSAFDWLRSRHSEFVNEEQRFTRPRLLRALRDAGFAVNRCTYANALLLPVAWFKFRVWEPLTGAPPSSGVVLPPRLLNRVLEIPLLLEAACFKLGLSLPLGQSLIALATKP